MSVRSVEQVPIGRVSVIVPMYNEAAHIGHFVRDLAAQNFAGEVEILVADGASEDGCAQLLADAAERAALELQIIPNPDRWVSHGLNACIERCTGELIVRLDCHSRYPHDYISASVRAAEETGAWAVGGVPTPIGTTQTERAVACALDGPFGGAHWTRNQRGGQRVEVDNFYCGAFRPQAFREAGVFDESLVRNQDDELNFRIRAAGGRLVLDPAITSQYVARGSFRGVSRQYYQYGFWKIPVMLKHRAVFSGRSLAPIGLLGSLALLAAAAPFSRSARRLLAAAAGLYAAAAITAGAESVRRRREPTALLPRVALAYPLMHLSYGMGMVVGVLRALQR